MQRLVFYVISSIIMCIFLSGCDTASPKAKGARPTKKQNAAAKQNADAAAAEPNAQGVENKTEDVQFKPGSNVPHHGGERATDIVAVPLHAMGWAKGKILISNIENHLKQYKAANERFPKDTDEFMKEIVKQNNLELPKLAAGETWFFDAQKGELMVRRPKQ